ncbi:N-acyl-D-amino-acid deacylase family protein [Natronorubrum aibiense]|nr:amidohydrolase family protein [Natronorubrum aibiense]
MDIGAELGIPLHHSHFKVTGPPLYETAERATDLMRYARDRGIDYTADQYPYTAGSTMLQALLPPWVKTGDSTETVELLRDSETRQQIKADIENWRLDNWHNPGPYTGWENIAIASLESETNEHCLGRSIASIANERDSNPVFVVCDLLIEEDLQVTITLHQLREESVQHIVRDELVSVGTDGLFGSGKPHPRVYGTFPKILEKYVREESLLSLEEVVRKMTSLPARIMGLSNKGLIRPGMDADLVVFDPRLVSTTADYENPRRYPKGIPHVLVNGEFVVCDNEVTGALPGQTIRA